jgi:16S rRNA (guanine527-N7)-methyltransferase
MDKWNRRINLTAVEDPEQRVIRHLLDSLSVHQHLGEARRLLDIGTGAGLPGVPLAIANPDSRWTLLDSSIKRISFLRVVVAQLDISNIELVHSRVESYQPDFLFDCVISRAFASLTRMADNAGRFLSPGGQILAMKGRYPEAEISDLPAHQWAIEVVELQVPNLAEARHLVKLMRPKP